MYYYVLIFEVCHEDSGVVLMLPYPPNCVLSAVSISGNL